MEETKQFFQSIGLEFVEEKHGNGPAHWACEINGNVLEIYPEQENKSSLQFY
jgi:hypothetical protein